MHKFIKSFRRDVNSNRGISLMEVILTVGLLLIVGSALVRLGIVSMSNSDHSRTRSAALQLADEGLEIARSVRDSQPTTFFGLTGNYAINSTLNGFNSTNCDPTTASFTPPASNSCEINVTITGSAVTFYRVVRITNTSGVTNSKDITTYVYWNNNSTYSNVSTSTILARWRT